MFGSISSESVKIETAAVKAALLDLGFVYERSSGVFIGHFDDGGWISLRESNARTFDSAARELGKFLFRKSSFARDAYHFSQSMISRACAFQDEQAALFASRIKI
jgi:hypothetical protein